MGLSGGILCGFLVLSAGSAQSEAKKILIRGSDTMVELAQAWAEEYKAADVEVEGGGSAIGISALIDGKVDIANSIRIFTDKEVEAAKKKTGKEPKLHIVGYEALAIYVHKDNPLEEITLDQLKELYGNGGRISSWSQLGVKVPGCTNDKIVLVGRPHGGGTYDYFREQILGNTRDYKQGIVERIVPKDVVALVGNTPCAIGYSRMGFKTDSVKFLKVKDKNGKAVGPSNESAYKKTYPISRPLFMYTAGEATGHIQAYLDWARSDAGQAILEKIGHIPLKPQERLK